MQGSLKSRGLPQFSIMYFILLLGQLILLNVAKTTKLLSNLPQYYADTALPVKQQLIGSVLAEKLAFEKTVSEPLNDKPDLQDWWALGRNKKKGSAKNAEPSSLVAPTGIEPVSSESESEILSIKLRSHISVEPLNL